VGKRLDLYKRESRTWEKGHRGTRAKTEQKFRAKKKIIHREKERKRE